MRVVVIAASFEPRTMNAELVRCFESKVLLDNLDEAARKQLLQREMKGRLHSVSDADFAVVAKRTHRWTARELDNLCDSAVMIRARRIRKATKARAPTETASPTITLADFKRSIAGRGSSRHIWYSPRERDQQLAEWVDQFKG